MTAISQRAASHLTRAVRGFELALAAAVLVGVLIAAVGSARELSAISWSDAGAFDRLIARVLSIAIGLELVRMLVVHSMQAILELLAFALARQVLTPGIPPVHAALTAVAFVALLAAFRYFVPGGRPPARPSAATPQDALEAPHP